MSEKIIYKSVFRKNLKEGYEDFTADTQRFLKKLDKIQNEIPNYKNFLKVLLKEIGKNQVDLLSFYAQNFMVTKSKKSSGYPTVYIIYSNLGRKGILTTFMNKDTKKWFTFDEIYSKQFKDEQLSSVQLI